MILSPRLMRGINRASFLHKDQIRRGKEMTPYVSHLYGVMYILSTATNDEDILLAGLFHDSLEDVKGYTKEMLAKEWGERVLSFVLGVTEPLNPSLSPEEQLPWLIRKEAYLKALESGPAESVMISCADKIHNMMSTEFAVENGDVTLVADVISHFRNQKLFYDKIFTIADSKLGNSHMLVKELKEHIGRVEKMLSA